MMPEFAVVVVTKSGLGRKEFIEYSTKEESQDRN